MKTSFKRVLCMCLTLCMLFGVLGAMPAFASTDSQVQVTITAQKAGIYTADSGNTGALNFTATVTFPEGSTLSGYGIQYVPSEIYNDSAVTEKPWITVESGAPISFNSGDAFSAELQDIPAELFADEFAVRAYAEVAGTRYYSEPAFAKVEGAATMGAKQTLQCDLNGNFTVLCVADPQSETREDWEEARTDMENAILRANPDFVMIQGDITDTNFITPAAFWDYFVEPLEERDIPWAVINGNHDSYSMVNQRLYESYENCLTTEVDFYDANFEPLRPVNFVLPVYANNGTDNVFAIWGMDTGVTVNSYGYPGVTAKQIAWYKAESEKLKANNDGTPVTGLMCLHIPLTETVFMYYEHSDGVTYEAGKPGDVYTIYGKNENYGGTSSRSFTTPNGLTVPGTSGLAASTAQNNNNGLYAAMIEQGDVKVTTFGHIHCCDFIGSYYTETDDVKSDSMLLGFTGKIGAYDPNDYLTRGGRVIRFNQTNPDALEASWVAVNDDSADQQAIDVDAKLVENPIQATVKARNYDAFLDKTVAVQMGETAGDLSVTASVTAVSIDEVTFTFSGIPEKIQDGMQTSYYSLLAYTGNADPAAEDAKLIYADRATEKPTEMKIPVGDLQDGKLYVKFAADGNGAIATEQTYLFAIVAYKDNEAVALKPYTTPGASLEVTEATHYYLYGGKLLNYEEASNAGLSVSGYDETEEFVHRRFRILAEIQE